MNCSTRRLSAAAGKKDLFSCVLQDNGSGISPQHLARIFDPFFFITKSEVKGTGPGLSVSSDIIKSHGGELRVESKAGAGTTVTLTLPAHGAEN